MAPDSQKKRTELIAVYRAELGEGLSTLQHSWNKLQFQQIPDLEVKNLDQLEPWEALTSRFARVTDIFVSKYLRLMVLDMDPAFRGETRDVLDKAEKTALISSADEWMKIRELRNKIAHEYSKHDLSTTLTAVLQYTPFVLTELGRLPH